MVKKYTIGKRKGTVRIGTEIRAVLTSFFIIYIELSMEIEALRFAKSQ